MATYAIGDLQGCYDEFRTLLDQFAFDPVQDRLWLVGDLVNRGPASLEVLRFVKGLGDRAQVVLGNHDLYLLKIAFSSAAQRKRRDTLQAVLDAPDRDELLDWLRKRPLMHVEAGHAMVHAGLLPCWEVAEARALAAEVEAVLAGPDFGDFLDVLWGNLPNTWHPGLSGVERWRVIVNAMTRMRFCSLAGEMEFDAKGGPDKVPRDHHPWFDHPRRRSLDTTVVCGHWSALGLKIRPDLLALDTGCVWGERLTAVRLEDRAVFQAFARAGRAS